MRALTLHQPWAWAIFHGKLVENRPMRPPAHMLGQVFAVHAGKVWDEWGAQFCARLLGYELPPEARTHGALLGTARLVRVAPATCTNPWFFGPRQPDGTPNYGYELADPSLLATPIPCRGMQGWWPVSPPLQDALRGATPPAESGQAGQVAFDLGGRR